MASLPLARLPVALAAGVALACCSCGSSGPKLYPVSGKVFYQDKPAEGATVTFVPVAATDASALKPSGKVGPDGAFSLSTYPHGDGAPAGEYVVLVSWYPPNAREVENPRNRLPARYSDPAAQLLKATVKEGPTELEPFKLK